MSFSRTIGALEKCDKKEILNLEDILGIITVDLFSDIKDTCGCAVVDLPISDETQYSKNIISLIKFVRRFSEKHQDILSRENRAATWEKENARISEVTGDIEEIEKEINKLAAKLTELSSKEDEHKKKLAEKKTLDEQIVMKTQLLAELDDKVREAEEIDSIINDLESVKIPEIDAYISSLEGKKQGLITGIENYNTIIGDILSRHRDQALNELRASKDIFASIQSDWIDAEAEHSALVNQSEQYSSMIKKSAEEAEKLRGTIQQLMYEQQSSNAELTKLEKRRQEEEAKFKSIKAESDKTAELLEKTISENLSISSVRDEFRQRLADRKREKEELDKEIDSLGKSITGYETEASKLEDEIYSIKSNNSEVLGKINLFKDQILEEKKKYDDSISKMRNYRLEYMISKKRADAHFKDYEIFLRKYAEVQSEYGRIIGDFLNDEFLKEGWAALTDEELRVSLNDKKNELDRLLKIELSTVSELLRQYDD